VGDGEGGRLVAPDDADALAEGLVQLAVDDALRAKLGAAAAVRAEAFSTENAATAMRAVYDELARDKGLS
jgi:glycosyltransferase involved in cell wall biosynthesis